MAQTVSFAAGPPALLRQTYHPGSFRARRKHPGCQIVRPIPTKKHSAAFFHIPGAINVTPSGSP